MGMDYRVVEKFARCHCRRRCSCVGTGSQEEYPRWLRNSLEDGLELMHENELISGYCKWVRAGPQEWSPR